MTIYTLERAETQQLPAARCTFQQRVSESGTEQRTKRLASYGWSQRRIADHLHITRYRVRMALAS
jgi:DNA-binding CsgD family transcriptional regulator